MPAAALAAPVSSREVLGIWLRHLCALLFPLNALVFLLTGPHSGWWPLAFVLPLAVAHYWDTHGGVELRQPRAELPALRFDALLLLLAALQVLNVTLLARYWSIQGFWTWDSLVGILVIGTNSGYSGIVVAHELIHRKQKWAQLLGRLLMCTVVYEHFYTEHLRGHHARVGTAEDPATARYGETFMHFYIRTVPAQFRSAWRLETQRLGDVNMRAWDPRQLRNRVVHGLVFEWGIAWVILATCGGAALAIFLLQALFASRALEVVNYFEHWGLLRQGARIQPVDSWDTTSWFTYYGLTGLTRHADHHAHASRPYQQLRIWAESPKLPRGYIGLFPLVLGRNKKFQKLMTEELKRCKLGPFLEESSVEA